MRYADNSILITGGATDESDAVSFPITGFDMGSLSMRAAILGGGPPFGRA